MTKKRNKGKARKRRGAANSAASSPSIGGVDAGQELGGAEQMVGNLSLGCDHGTPRLNKCGPPSAFSWRNNSSVNAYRICRKSPKCFWIVGRRRIILLRLWVTLRDLVEQGI